MTAVPNISVDHFAKLRQKKDVDLIDVRTPAEFRDAHIDGAQNIPLDALSPQAVIAMRQTDAGPIYLICQAGSRGANACQKFLDAGFRDVVNIEGGTRAWMAAGLPVVRGKKSISLERQVRILAGLLVLVSAVLGLLVHPYFMGLAAFVGAGLLFAGMTDTCGMAMLLAKMPWNRASGGG
jgi:rhodanese-related sulfurtransferase